MSNVSAGRDATNVSVGRDAFNFGTANNVVINTGDHSRGGAASGSRDVRRDSFRPSFHVPSNPRGVVLDFGDPLDHAQPQTQEARVLQEILRDDYDESGTRVIGIYGKGGVGKSCILRALARHEKVKERFPGGVYFLSLGMDAGMDKLTEGLVGITKISGGQELATKLLGEDNLQVVLKEIRGWMNDKKSLLLVDDFWQRNGLGSAVVEELAQIFSSGSVVALTTRFVSVATLGTEIEVQPHESTSERAEAILLGHAKFEREEIEDEETYEVFVKLLKMCAGLPLFLSVVGKAVTELYVLLKVERRLVWGVYWKTVQGREDDMLLTLPLEPENDEYPENHEHAGLGKTLLVSLEILCKGRGKGLGSLSKSKYSLFEIHRSLCVFKKQTAIPITVCRRLWNVKSDVEAVQIAKGFAVVGLGDIEVETVGGRSVMFLRLHDLIHIFAVQCAKERNEMSMWHERLLEGYISRQGSGESVREWWNVEEKSGEEYLFGNLCRHLARSGNVKELAGLLLCGEWIKLRHEHGGLSAWKQDCSEYLQRKMVVALSESEKEIETGVRMVRDAVVESWVFVHENPYELGYQMFGRLVDCNNSVVEKFLESIQRVQCGPWLKAMQRCWTPPGEGGMVAEFDLGSYICDIAVQKDPFIAAVAVGKEIVIIDLEEMTVRSRCIGHTGYVEKVAMSSDRNRVFSWSRDCTVRQWYIQSGSGDIDKCVWLKDEESDEDDGVTCVAFCVEKRLVVTGSWAGRVKVWDLNSGERKGSKMEASKSVSCIEMSPNGETIAVGTEGGTILLWDMQTFKRLGGKLKGHLGEVRSIAFSSDGRFAASVGGFIYESLIRLWNIQNRTKARGPFWGCRYYASCIALKEDDEQIICGQWDGSVAVRNVASGAEICSWKAHSDWVERVAVSTDLGGRCAVITCASDIMRVWDLLETENVRDERIQHKSRVECVAASPDGQFFVSASNDKTLRIWNAADGTARGGPLCGHDGPVECVAVSPDILRLVSGSWDRTVRVWDVATGAQVGNELRGHEDGVNCVAYSKDGRFVVSGSYDCTARVWRVTESPHIDEDVNEPKAKRVISAEPEAHELLSSREPLRLEMILNHGLEDEEHNSRRSVTAVSMSPDGQRVLSGMNNGEIWVWNVTSRECICRTRFSDGKRINKIEISTTNEIVTTNMDYEKLRWWPDEEGGLTRGLENEDGSGIAQAEAQEGSVAHCRSSIVCDGQTVLLTGSSEKIATLPEAVSSRAWKYDYQRRVLCAGLRDGRVLFFRVHC